MNHLKKIGTVILAVIVINIILTVEAMAFNAQYLNPHFRNLLPPICKTPPMSVNTQERCAQFVIEIVYLDNYCLKNKGTMHRNLKTNGVYCKLPKHRFALF